MAYPDIIGLLLIKDEQDILKETLQNHIRFCHKIFVLDGTVGPGQIESQRICQSFAQVLEYHRDQDTGIFPVRDGVRQYLLERARRQLGIGRWYAVLHGDEIWGEDPRSLCLQGHDGLAVRLYHFFPHSSQQHTWDLEAPAEDRCRWYMRPGIPESRLFFDNGRNFEVNRHSVTVPAGLKVRQTELVVKSYNYRSPLQAHARAVARKDHRWQTNHYAHLLQGPQLFFRESLGQGHLRWADFVPAGGGTVDCIDNNPLPCWRV